MKIEQAKHSTLDLIHPLNILQQVQQRDAPQMAADWQAPCLKAQAARGFLQPSARRVPLWSRRKWPPNFLRRAERSQEDCEPVPVTSSSPHIPLTQTVLLQGFGWESWHGSRGKSWWQVVKEKVPEIQAAGVTHIWLPPPSQSVDPQGYLPGQLYGLNTSGYGTEQQLVELNRALLHAGVQPVCDIVINHRCADEKDESGRWTRYRDDVDHKGRRIDWGKWAITCNDPDYHGAGRPDTGDDYGAAPDLDHTNPELRASLIDWMSWLHTDIGFQGWRFDFVRGYGAQYVREYIEGTLDTHAFCVGEYFVDLRWSGGYLEYNQEDATNTLLRWIREAQHCSLFDFVTKGTAQEAIKRTEYDRLRGGNGRPPGLMGALPERCCTFIDNHDTGSTQKHWPWPSEYVMLGYAYILTHPGIPCIFWEHFFDWGLADKITQLVKLRKRQGIEADSKVEIQAAEKDLYVAKIADRVVVKLGPRFDMPPRFLPNAKDGWGLVTYGKDYAVWELKGQL